MSDTIYTVRGRITRGAICVLEGESVRALRADDPVMEDDRDVLVAADGMHAGDRAFILGRRVRRLRKERPA